MSLPVAVERLDDSRVIGREVRGPVVGHDGHLILRQQPFLHEPDRRLDTFHRTNLASAPEDDEEDALVLWRHGFAERLSQVKRPVTGRFGRRRQPLEEEMDDALRNAVFDDGEFGLLQVRDWLATAIDDADVYGDYGDPGTKGRGLAGLLRLLAGAQDGSHGYREPDRHKSSSTHTIPLGLQVATEQDSANFEERRRMFDAYSSGRRLDRRLNIRLSSKDLEAIQKRALAEGLP